jgi:hypothetical protein
MKRIPLWNRGQSLGMQVPLGCMDVEKELRKISRVLKIIREVRRVRKLVHSFFYKLLRLGRLERSNVDQGGVLRSACVAAGCCVAFRAAKNPSNKKY